MLRKFLLQMLKQSDAKIFVLNIGSEGEHFRNTTSPELLVHENAYINMEYSWQVYEK